MGLVDDEQPDVRPPQALEEPGRGEPLRRDVEQPHVARHRLLDRAAVGRGVALRVDERDTARRHALERLDLVLHQRHQRRDHEREVRAHQRRKLVAERLARARRHHHEHVAVRERGADRVRLAGPEGGEAEQLVQRAHGVRRARDGLRRGRPEAGQREGGGGFHGPPDITPTPGGLRPFARLLAQSRDRVVTPWSSTDYLAELTRRLQRACSATSCSASTPAAPTRSAPTSRAAATSTSPRSPPAPLAPATKQAIVERLRHEALPCPARGLELVVYPLATARAGGGEPGFELNLNTGADMGFRVDEAPGEIEGFWFAIDRAILRDARRRAGRPAGRGPVRPDPARHAAAAAAGVDPLAPRQRRPARLRHRAQHLPRAALRVRGDVVVQARGGRLGRRRADRGARRSPARRSTAPPWCASSTPRLTTSGGRRSFKGRVGAAASPRIQPGSRVRELVLPGSPDPRRSNVEAQFRSQEQARQSRHPGSAGGQARRPHREEGAARAAATPPKGGGQTRRPIRHQGR